MHASDRLGAGEFDQSGKKLGQGLPDLFLAAFDHIQRPAPELPCNRGASEYRQQVATTQAEYTDHLGAAGCLHLDQCCHALGEFVAVTHL